jgi:hypothetical protein
VELGGNPRVQITQRGDVRGARMDSQFASTVAPNSLTAIGRPDTPIKASGRKISLL